MKFMFKRDTAPQQIGLDTFLEAIDYRVARTRGEAETSYSLVYQEYLKRGYTDESASGLTLSIYNALPSTATFVAMYKEDVVATATLIADSPLGLPMDALYREELDALRRQNKKICEISMLASNTDLFCGGTSLMLNSKKMMLVFYLFKIVLDYGKDILKLDDICIAINPKHRLTYEFLMFKDMGSLKSYPRVNNAPAMAKYLDIALAEDECRKKNKQSLLTMFFLNKLDPRRMEEKIRLQAKDLEYFFMEKTDTFKTAAPDQLNYIRECYPALDLDSMLK